jgi:hypothetical protein
MTKKHVSELEGVELDYWTAKADGKNPMLNPKYQGQTLFGLWTPDGEHFKKLPRYSESWGWGGPIIDRHVIALDPRVDEAGNLLVVHAYCDKAGGSGKTHLIAAMRAFVVKNFGDFVDVVQDNG